MHLRPYVPTPCSSSFLVLLFLFLPSKRWFEFSDVLSVILTVMLEFLTVSSLSVFGVSSLLSLKFLCHHKSCCIENVWISRWYDWSYFHMFYCVGLRLNLKMQHCMNECLQSLLSLKPNFIPRKKKIVLLLFLDSGFGQSLGSPTELAAASCYSDQLVGLSWTPSNWPLSKHNKNLPLITSSIRH